MISTFAGAAVWVFAAGLGCGHHPFPAPVPACEPCAVPTNAVAMEIDRLEHAPRWRDRDRAARELRRVDWHREPAVVAALVNALRNDGAAEVREEAAVALGRIEACVPVAHVALRRAADCDPDLCTRKAARRALKRLDRRCEGDCPVCKGTPDVVTPRVIVAPALPAEEPVLSAPSDAPPPTELPMPLPEVNPAGGPTTDTPDLEPPLDQGRRVSETRAERPRIRRLLPLPNLRDRLAALRRGR
ncbi:MAG TPA: HEAT repeat domain-containing protein [Isosphaeraceae bacterium]|jgi:hypothetical protein|nr:HEAT repeat domain-containing protein [Isosphaeraceae bacterium]